MLVIDRLPFIIFCPSQIRYTSWYQITGQYQILTNGLLKSWNMISDETMTYQWNSLIWISSRLNCIFEYTGVVCPMSLEGKLLLVVQLFNTDKGVLRPECITIPDTWDCSSSRDQSLQTRHHLVQTEVHMSDTSHNQLLSVSWVRAESLQLYWEIQHNNK